MKSKPSLSLHQQYSQASKIQHQDYCEQITDYRQSIQRELLGAEFSAANNQTRSMDLTLTRGIIKSKGSLRQIKAFHCQRHFEKFKLIHWYSSASVSLDQSPLLFFLSFFHIITAHRGLNIWHPQGYLLNFLNHLSWGGALYGAEFLPEVTPAL